jgi:S-adenosylmethionine/arginine decarboxylase-like enzyme
MIYHKHLLINSKIDMPIMEEQKGVYFLSNLVDTIGMKAIITPIARYVDKPGNRGLTAVVLIETSHIAFHIWDEQSPALIQFDLYTCGELEVSKVLKVFTETFRPVDLDYVLYDRENGFVIEASGSMKGKYEPDL